MSDIQDLIHKTSIDCIKQGERQATEKIIRVLEQASIEFEQYDFHAVGVTNGLISRVREQQNGRSD